MSRWFRFYTEALDDPKVQTLTGDQFKAALLGALRGEETPFLQFIKEGFDRLHPREWAAIRAYIFERDDYTCSYCGERAKRLECDHIFPVSRGGTHEEENLTTACFDCNRSKRDKTVEEWCQ